MGIDFNYFFNSSPKQEVRDKYEDILIESYHTSLAQMLKKLNYSPIPTLNDVKNEIKSHQFYGEYFFYLSGHQRFSDYFFSGVFAITCVLPVILMERNENIECKFESLQDFDSDFKKLQFSGKTYQEAIKNILLKFDKDGVFD